MRRRAWLRLRAVPSYRRDAFTAGLQRLGYEVVNEDKGGPRPGDVLVIWNRRRQDDAYAKQFERIGAKVLVVENAYISPAWGQKWFAMALGHHLGAGAWRRGDFKRWESFGIELKPWRRSGEHVLMLPQRGIGEPGIAMPGNWVSKTRRRLEKMTDREIVFRRHPGQHPQKISLEAQLERAHCAITWGSGAAIKALAEGVPVFYDLAQWIGGLAATRFGAVYSIESAAGCDDERLRMFQRLAWSQWEVGDVQSGKALAWFLE